MTKPSNIDAIEQKTGTPWQSWLDYLESIDAKDLPHKEIANHLRNKLASSLDNAGWWAQSITVAYEQHIGRRNPGQRSDGSYEAAISKTITGSMDDAMNAWLKLISDKKDFNGISLAQSPTITQTNKRRHWACNLSDRTRVNVDTSPKTPDKAILTVTHIKLKDSKSVDQWKTYWKTQLENVH